MDKFTKMRNIGKGNMGACALARNNEDGKYYVIKQVDLTKMDKKQRQQSLNEARVLSSLRHPNIITYVDSFLARKSDHLCIVMEFADGGDLSSRIKKNYGVNFKETQVLDWFIQIVLSLHYVHQRKILHRDVKTQNVFLTSDGQVKLGDFGIAKTLSGTYDQAKTFVGTPYYLSPELILEQPYDYRSDVWAIGVVLYELLTLKHPFNGTDLKDLMQRILKVQYDPIPSTYSAEMRNVVPRLLVKDSARRIRLGEILELPIVNRRLVDWLSGDIVPKKYLDTLLSQNLLPESVIALTKGLEGPLAPPISAVSLDSGRASDVSNESKAKKQLPPLQPLSSKPLEMDKLGVPPESSVANQGRDSPDNRLASSPSESLSKEESHADSSTRNGNSSVPNSARMNTQKSSAKIENPKPTRSPAMYRYFKSPGLQPVSARNQIQLNSDNPGPTRLNSQDNFYHQMNYYQRASNNRDLYRHYGQRYLHPNLPALRRQGNGARMETGQAAAHLHPLFHANNNNNNISGARDHNPRSQEFRAMLQRANARKKMGT